MIRRPYRSWSSFAYCQPVDRSKQSITGANRERPSVSAKMQQSAGESIPMRDMGDQEREDFGNDQPASADEPSSSKETPEYRFDINKYATKKTIAQGMLDIALLTSNVTQLKTIITAGTDNKFFFLAMALVSVSIALQCLNGFVYVALGFLNVDSRHIRATRTLNMLSLILVLLISAVNIVLEPFKVRPAGTGLTLSGVNPAIATAIANLPTKFVSPK